MQISQEKKTLTLEEINNKFIKTTITDYQKNWFRKNGLTYSKSWSFLKASKIMKKIISYRMANKEIGKKTYIPNLCYRGHSTK